MALTISHSRDKVEIAVFTEDSDVADPFITLSVFCSVVDVRA